MFLTMQECIAILYWETFKREKLIFNVWEPFVKVNFTITWGLRQLFVCACACLLPPCLYGKNNFFKIFIVSLVLTIKCCVMLFQLPDEVCIWWTEETVMASLVYVAIIIRPQLVTDRTNIAAILKSFLVFICWSGTSYNIALYLHKW